MAMAVPASANYLFLPWVRQEAAAGIQTPDMSANRAATASIECRIGSQHSTIDLNNGPARGRISIHGADILLA